MKQVKNNLIAGSLVVLIAGVSTATIARQDGDTNLVNSDAIGVEEAVNIASAQVAGKVVETELEQEDGKLVWEVEIVGDDNLVSEVIIDAHTGKVLETEIED